MSTDLREAILRIEGIYDPTRLDGTGQTPRFLVRAGTASTNNVFGDRWSIADTDANVDYVVAYIAAAWTKHGAVDCGAFRKRAYLRAIIVSTALDVADCKRLENDGDWRDDTLKRLPIVRAVLSVPAFAAPPPGGRMNSHDFWVAQQAKIRMLKEAMALRRQTTLVAQRTVRWSGNLFSASDPATAFPHSGSK